MIVFHIAVTAAADYLTRREAHRRDHIARLQGLRANGILIGGGPSVDGATADLFYRLQQPAQLKHAIEEEVANLLRTRLWAWHHQVKAPTLLLRAPDGLLGADDCLMTQEEAEAMAHAIPDCRLVVAPGTNHYTVLLSDNPVVRRAVTTFLGA